MTLGTKLRNLRMMKNESLETLAIKLEISKTAIGKWEADKTKPSIDNLIKICYYHEIDLYKLLENVDFNNAELKESFYATYAKNFVQNDISPQIINRIITNQKTINNVLRLQNELIAKLLEKT